MGRWMDGQKNAIIYSYKLFLIAIFSAMGLQAFLITVILKYVVPNSLDGFTIKIEEVSPI